MIYVRSVIRISKNGMVENAFVRGDFIGLKGNAKHAIIILCMMVKNVTVNLGFFNLKESVNHAMKHVESALEPQSTNVLFVLTSVMFL